MSVQRKLAGAILAGSLLFTAAACGGSGKSSSDKLAEKLAKDKGVNVDINSKKGTYTYTDDQGNETKVGTGTELPDDWPEDLQPPDGVTLVSSSTSTQGDKKVLSVVAEADVDVKTIYEGLKEQLKSGEYEISSDMSGGSGDGAYANLSATKGDVTANVSMGSSTDGNGKTSIIFSVEMPA
jgi:hypothetical protein